MSRNENNGFGFCNLESGWEIGRFDVLSDLEGISHLVTAQRGPDLKDMLPHAGCDGFLARTLGLNGLAWCDQVHGKTIIDVSQAGSAGRGDGLITNVCSLGLVVRSADCPIILVADPAGRAIGVAHASWRGTVRRIASKLIESLAMSFAVEPGKLTACITPSAGPCCYEVQQDVQDAAIDGIGEHTEEFFHWRDGKTYLDLWAANVDELMRAGIQAGNIHVAGICTICSGGRFPSYRAEGDAAGRFGAVLAIR